MTNAGLRFVERELRPAPRWTVARYTIWVLLLMAVSAWGVLIVTW
jgi:hypothetical protein